MISFITEYSVNVCIQKTKNKIPWAHTVIKRAVHAYQWSYIYTPLTCFHSMGVYNCVAFLCRSIVSKSNADGAALQL